MDCAYSFPFEKLAAWQGARRLVRQVYAVTKGFPADEKFALVNQINRAVVSVASNLAEGSSRTSLKDQAHFSQIAYGSLMELACQITMATDLGFASAETTQNIRQEINRLANMINALRTSQLARQGKGKGNS
jgi:four helix bundle protein